VKGKGGHREERGDWKKQMRIGAYHFISTLVCSSFSWHGRRVSLFTQHRSQRHTTSCANTRSKFCLYPLPLPPMVRLTTLRHLRNQSQSVHKLSANTLLYLWGGTIGEGWWCFSTAMTGKGHGNAIVRRRNWLGQQRRRAKDIHVLEGQDPKERAPP
jgi:hypothetical protein